jgi:hypothetical protein
MVLTFTVAMLIFYIAAIFCPLFGFEIFDLGTVTIGGAFVIGSVMCLETFMNTARFD